MTTGEGIENRAAEEALLGSIILDPQCIWIVNGVVRPADFSIVKNGFIYSAAVTLSEDGKPIDLVTLSDELSRQGHAQHADGAYILGLMNSVPSAMNALSYAESVSEDARRRGLLQLATDIAKRAYDRTEDVDKTVTYITSKANEQARGGEIKHAPDVVMELSKQFESYIENPLQPNEVRGLDTGWRDLNNSLGGWKPGLYVVLGEPHVGKSFFAITAAQHVAERGGRALVFSLEMTAAQLILRLCLSHTRTTQRDYDSGRVSQDKIDSMYERMAEISEWNLDIVDDLETASGILSTIHRESRGGLPPDLVVIDYLGLIVTDYRKDNRNQELSQLTRAVKRTSDACQVPIIAPHQISDKAIMMRQDKRPKKSDGYNSGGISQHSDVILGLYDESLHTNNPENKNTLEVTKLKDRLSGGADAFNRVLLTFEDTGALRDRYQGDDPGFY